MRKRVITLVVIIISIILIIISINLVKKDDKIVICLDAGHGGSDVGAVLENRYEKDDTLKIAKLVKKYLEEQDIKVIMTREKDENVTLYERCKMANKKKADLFISIHRNSATAGNGIEIWVNSKKESKDINLANSILNNLEKTKIQNNRGIKYGTIKGENTDYYVLTNTHMPSCLIELGFITDSKDNELLDNNAENYAKAIAKGIIKEIEEGI